MREIVHIQVGQCGNQIGAKFWEVIADEHGIDPTGSFRGVSDLQLERINVYFNEAYHGKYVPRSVMVDLEPGAIESVRAHPYSEMFRPDSFIFGQSGAGNNWAKGFYTEGAELVDYVMDVIRKEAEICDSLQGFQLVHSIGGGTGGGMGTLLVSKLREEFPDRMLFTYSIFPSTAVFHSHHHHYNPGLSLHQLTETTDAVICIDQSSLYNIWSNGRSNFNQPMSMSEANNLVCTAMSGITCNFRSNVKINNNLRDMAVNLIPFPRLHFLIATHAPFTPIAPIYFRPLTVVDIVHNLFDPINTLAEVDNSEGRCLAAAAMFRGSVKADVEQQMFSITSKNSQQFVQWIPDSLKTTISTIPQRNSKLAATLLTNNTAIQQVFNRVGEQWKVLFRRKVALHWYLGEGMEEMEFTEAESNLGDLISEYQQYQDASKTDG